MICFRLKPEEYPMKPGCSRPWYLWRERGGGSSRLINSILINFVWIFYSICLFEICICFSVTLSKKIVWITCEVFRDCDTQWRCSQPTNVYFQKSFIVILDLGKHFAWEFFVQMAMFLNHVKKVLKVKIEGLLFDHNWFAEYGYTVRIYSSYMKYGLLWHEENFLGK